MAKIKWIKKKFIVLDAAQTTESALSLIRRSRVQWVVVGSRGRSGTHWYVFKAKEMVDRLTLGQSQGTVKRVLELRVVDASDVLAKRLPESPTRHRKATEASANRVITTSKTSGMPTDIGEITKDVVAERLKHKSLAWPIRSKKAIGIKRKTARPKKISPNRKLVRRPDGKSRGGGELAARPKEKAAKKKASKWPIRELSTYAIVPVFFATDREIKKQSPGRFKFLNKRSSDPPLNYGISKVSIPRSHKVGEIESPNWLKLQFFSDPEKHVTLLSSELLSVADYFDALRASVNHAADSDAFIFVHGYNVGFEAAILRTAQIAYDLQFRGAPILYSWPSRATISGYMADEATIEVSAKVFQRFVIDVASKAGVKTLHIIAHSMGNRALLLALERLASASRRPAINNVVLAAPDIDAERFYQIAEAIKGYPGRVTLYASSRDKALKASMKLHGAPRAGESGENIVISPHVDTVDASSVDTDFLGHSQFADRRELLADIFELLSNSTPPHRRFGLQAKLHQRGSHWMFRP